MHSNDHSDAPSLSFAKRALSIVAALVIAPAIAVPLFLAALLCLPIALFALPWMIAAFTRPNEDAQAAGRAVRLRPIAIDVSREPNRALLAHGVARPA